MIGRRSKDDKSETLWILAQLNDNRDIGEHRLRNYYFTFQSLNTVAPAQMSWRAVLEFVFLLQIFGSLRLFETRVLGRPALWKMMNHGANPDLYG